MIRHIVHLIRRSIAFRKYQNSTEIKKLQIGSGKNKLPGFFNTDLQTGKKVYFLDAAKKYPFQDGTFNYIFSEHIFEHLTYEQGKSMLRECYRVLQKDGILRLTMPCLEFLIDLYNNPEKPDNEAYRAWHSAKFATEMQQDFEGIIPTAILLSNYMHMWGHQCLYDRPTIHRMLKNAGFHDIKFQPVSVSDDPELMGLEHHQTIIPERFNTMETICLECRK